MADNHKKSPEELFAYADLFASMVLREGAHSRISALRAIKSFASINKAIPIELIPYLNEACDHFINNPGNAVTNELTAAKWGQRVVDVEVLRKCGGYKLDDAIKAIVERDDNYYEISSLRAKWKGHPSKKADLPNRYIQYLSDQGYSLPEIVQLILTYES